MQADETFKPRLQWSEMFRSYIEQNQGGLGGGLIPNFLRKFSACVWKFFMEGGGLTYSKTFEELFSLSLDIFQEEGGGA